MEATKTAAVKISDEILKKTTRCTKDFSCLSGETGELCKVESCIENKIHFIKCIKYEPCQYRMTFGYSFVCTCPTRKELYNLYRI